MGDIDRLYLGEALPDAFIGVALSRVRREQYHSGVAWRISSDNQGQLLHLQWHRDLRLDVLDTDSYAVSEFRANGTKIPAPRVHAFAGLMRRIDRRCRKGEIPYSFSLKSAIDQETGAFVRGPDDAPGFTCATFVLAVFRAAGYELLADGWPTRSEDEQWQSHILEHLRHSADGDHIAALENLKGVVRYRPSEVSAGALKDFHPARFEDVQELAEQLRELLR